MNILKDKGKIDDLHLKRLEEDRRFAYINEVPENVDVYIYNCK